MITYSHVLPIRVVKCICCGSTHEAPDTLLLRAFDTRSSVTTSRPVPPARVAEAARSNIEHVVIRVHSEVAACPQCFHPREALASSSKWVLDELQGDVELWV